MGGKGRVLMVNEKEPQRFPQSIFCLDSVLLKIPQKLAKMSGIRRVIEPHLAGMTQGQKQTNK